MHAIINWINYTHPVLGVFICIALGIGLLALVTGAVQLATRGSVITPEELAANSPSAEARRALAARHEWFEAETGHREG